MNTPEATAAVVKAVDEMMAAGARSCHAVLDFTDDDGQKRSASARKMPSTAMTTDLFPPEAAPKPIPPHQPRNPELSPTPVAKAAST